MLKFFEGHFTGDPASLACDNLFCFSLFSKLFIEFHHNFFVRFRLGKANLIEKFEVNYKENLTAACNVRCACSHANYEPVCGGKKTYFSPCHAGCTNLHTYTSVEGLTVRVIIHTTALKTNGFH